MGSHLLSLKLIFERLKCYTTQKKISPRHLQIICLSLVSSFWFVSGINPFKLLQKKIVFPLDLDRFKIKIFYLSNLNNSKSLNQISIFILLFTIFRKITNFTTSMFNVMSYPNNQMFILK